MPKSTKKKLDYMTKYESSPEEVKKRVERNRARRHAIADGKAVKGDGRDVAHKVALENKGSGADSNTKMDTRKHNRGWRKGQKGYKVPNDI